MRRYSLAVLLGFCAVQGAAQGPVAVLNLSGGSATDLRGIRSTAYLAAASLNFLPDPNLMVAASGRGIRFADESWSVGGTLTAAARLPLGRRFSLNLAGAGDAVYASYHATYLQAEITPAAEFRLGAVRVWGGVRGAVARSSLEPTLTRPVQLPGPTTPSITTRSIMGPSFGAELRVTGSALGNGLRLTYREEHERPEGRVVVDRAAAAAVTHGPLLLAATLGFREVPGERRSFGGGQAAVNVVSGAAVFGAGEWYPSNRLTGAPGGRSFRAGVVLSTGGPHSSKRLPRPAGVAAPAAGLTRLSIEAKYASTVEVAGDWNQWRPVPIRRSGNGVWYGDFAIPPGAYRYAFRLDGRTWKVPKGVAAVNDGFGGKAAWLSVPETGRQSVKSATPKEDP